MGWWIKKFWRLKGFILPIFGEWFGVEELLFKLPIGLGRKDYSYF